MKKTSSKKVYISNGKISDTNLLRGLTDGWYQLESVEKRSLNQNDYYWWMCDIIKDALRDLGWDWIRTKNDVHKYLSETFLRRTETNLLTGDTFTRTLSTTELNKTQMNEYWKEIWKFAAEELSFSIPEPNEQSNFFNPL